MTNKMACCFHVSLLVLFGVVLTFAPVTVSGLVNYQNLDAGLLAINYAEIPNNVQLIDVSRNELSSLEDLPDFSALITLKINDNFLTVFPNLGNVGDTLVLLSIARNPLTFVDPARLNALTSLESLTLSDSYITSLPDMLPGMSNIVYLRVGTNRFDSFPMIPGIAENVQELRFGGNHIGTPPYESLALFPNLLAMYYMNCTAESLPDFRALPKDNGQSMEINLFNNFIQDLDKNILAYLDSSLWTISLDQNLISRIPNMMWASVDAGITLADNPIVCDCHLRWLKTASTGIDQTSMVCQHPPQHNGTDLASLSFEELNCDGPTRETQISTFDPAAAPNPRPPIGNVDRVRSRFECATRCINDDACLIFAFRITPDGPECALTDAMDMAHAVTGAPSGEWGDNDVSWYLTDT